MSQFFDQASLVMVPSGYKNGKVYSQKPLSADGELTFTRSNDTATRVASNGLIERVRTNLILQSQDFTTTWAQNASPTITANTTVAPDGTTTADTIAASAGSSGVYQYPSVNSGSAYAFSIYIKNISSATAITIGCDITPSGGSLVFNAVTGTITSVGGNVTASSVTNEGNGWYRVFGTYVSTGTNNTFIIYGGGVMSFAVWGAMLQESDVLTPYIATTTAAVSVGPVANLPRLDYSGGATCPRLILEGQRSNLYTFSEQTDNAAWGKTNASITANNTASPDGYTNADKVIADTTNGVHRIEQDRATAAQVATQSVFAKASGYNFIALENGGGLAYFNISTGVVGTVSGGTASIQDYGNGWYRCIFTATAANTKSYVYIANADNSASFAGDNTSGAFIWGCQFESSASYASSYIPTLGAAVTRGADAASKTGISSLIGQTEGTLFLDFVAQTTTTAQSHIWLGAAGSEIGVYGPSSFVFYSSGGVSINGGAFVTGQRYKIAFGYKANDYVVYVNGVQKGTDTSATVPAMSALYINSYSDFTETQKRDVNQVLLFQTRLTNAQLAELTTI